MFSFNVLWKKKKMYRPFLNKQVCARADERETPTATRRPKALQQSSSVATSDVWRRSEHLTAPPPRGFATSEPRRATNSRKEIKVKSRHGWEERCVQTERRLHRCPLTSNILFSKRKRQHFHPCNSENNRQNRFIAYNSWMEKEK